MDGQHELVPGALLFGRYRVVTRLGSPGDDDGRDVYEVEDTATKRRRLLHLIRPGADAQLDAPTRARIDASLAAAEALEAKELLAITDRGYDEACGLAYAVTERPSRERLSDRLATRGPLTSTEAAAVVRDVTRALAAAHAAGVVHEAVRPSCIWLADENVDARDDGIDGEERFAWLGGLGVDRARALAQVPPYLPTLAPEQVEHGRHSAPSTDCWALGLVAFEALTGESFWARTEGTLSDRYRALLMDPIPQASERAAARDRVLPPGFDAFFARCVARDPAARFVDAREALPQVAAAFAEGADDDPVRRKIAERRARFAQIGPWSDEGHPWTCLSVYQPETCLSVAGPQTCLIFAPELTESTRERIRERQARAERLRRVGIALALALAALVAALVTWLVLRR
jgi:hypothetical protein